MSLSNWSVSSVFCRLVSGTKPEKQSQLLKYPCQSNAVSSECVFYLSRVIESEDETPPHPAQPLRLPSSPSLEVYLSTLCITSGHDLLLGNPGSQLHTMADPFFIYQ